MHTDLIHNIGRRNVCDPLTSNDTSDAAELKSVQGVVLSKRKFYDIDKLSASIGQCASATLSTKTFGRYNWTCFESGNASRHDFNWLFVNCAAARTLSIRCLTPEGLGMVLENLCGPLYRKPSCQEFRMNGRTVWCSKMFRIEKTYHRVTSLSKPGKLAKLL